MEMAFNNRPFDSINRFKHVSFIGLTHLNIVLLALRPMVVPAVVRRVPSVVRVVACSLQEAPSSTGIVVSAFKSTVVLFYAFFLWLAFFDGLECFLCFFSRVSAFFFCTD